MNTETRHTDRRGEEGYLYTVLNLPVFATESEIKDRHRALSLVFHPDKQPNECLKKVATEEFLEIQAAYEVLSDPFLREVYDTLGYEGLKLSFPDHLKRLPSDELRPALREFLYESRVTQVQSQINSRATLTCSLDARDLCDGGPLAQEWYADLSERLASLKLSVLSLRHSFSKRLGQQTKLQLVSKLGYPGVDEADVDKFDAPNRYVLLRGNVYGIISHQYSPTRQVQVRASLLNLRGFTLSWTHEDKLNLVRVSAPIRPTFALPSVNLTFRRRLFRDSLTLGAIDCVLNHGKIPVVNIGLTKPTVARKESAFAFGWATGVSLRGTTPGPVAYVEYQAAWPALSTFLKIGSELSLLTGLASTIEGAWSSETKETDVSAAVAWSVQGIVLRISVSHLGQTLVLPVTLADEYSPRLVMLATLVPASAFALTEYLVLRKLRATKRTRRREEHELAQQDQLSGRRAEAEAIMAMLKDTARRSLESEKRNDGLVVLEALYLPLEDNGTPMPDLGISVTAAIQALIHDGQLYIPGGRSKSVLRGFYDPLPECAKRLSVRYEFRGRMHYVEIGEHAPLVLPLESHLVERTDEEWAKPSPAQLSEHS